MPPLQSYGFAHSWFSPMEWAELWKVLEYVVIKVTKSEQSTYNLLIFNAIHQSKTSAWNTHRKLEFERQCHRVKDL